MHTYLVKKQVSKQRVEYFNWLSYQLKTMFHVFGYLLCAFCIFEPCIAKLRISDLKGCKEEQHESKICLTGENGYLTPFPVIVNSDLELRKLIEIDENKNSISAQFELGIAWLDPGINLSNISSG